MGNGLRLTIGMNDEPADAPQPRTVLCRHGYPIPRGEVIRGVPDVKQRGG